MKIESDFSMVFQGSLTEIQQVQNILQANDIDSFLQNANIGQLFPHYGGHGGVKPVKLLVRKEDINKAQEIIQSYFTDFF